METNYPTIAGKDLIWHTDLNEKPTNENVLVAYSYKDIKGNEVVADKLFFDSGTIYLKEDKTTYPVAWAYFDCTIPFKILNNMIEDRKRYDIENAAEIKAKRIAELEAELAELKK